MTGVEVGAGGSGGDGGSAPTCYTRSMLPGYFVLIGTIISGMGTVSYFVDTLKGRIKPNRVSFFLWSLFPGVAFAAQMAQGVGWVGLMTFSQAVLPFLVFLASFVSKEAEWRLTRFDLCCGLLAIIGLIAWQITQVGNIAIIFSIMADALACLPTIVKAYKHPETEAAYPWLATAVGVMLSLLTINDWGFAGYGFLVYLLIANMVIFSLVKFNIGSRSRQLS